MDLGPDPGIRGKVWTLGLNPGAWGLIQLADQPHAPLLAHVAKRLRAAALELFILFVN